MLEPLDSCGQVAAEAICKKIQDHISQRYPSSSHWDPSKVTCSGNGTKGEVNIDIPGAGRAYHDIDIYPVNAEWLTIPVHPDAKGKSAREFSNLFKPKDHNILAANENGSLVVYYALSKHVHQSQDRSLLPTEKEMLEAAREAAASTIRQ